MTLRHAIISALSFLLVAMWGCHSHDHHHGHEEAGHGHAESDPSPHKEEGGHHGHGHHQDGPEPESRTTWSGATAGFVEFPPLVKDAASSFAAHFTWRADWNPVASGTLTVLLSGGDSPEERFSIEGVSQPGIFRPVATPRFSGARTMTLELRAGDVVDRHDLGPVTVAAKAEDVKAAEAEDASGQITLLLEQQWLLDFRVEVVSERPIREGIAVYGRVRELPDGVTRVRAPVDGRLMAPEGALPALGDVLERDQVVASILPMLEPEAGDRAGKEQEEAKVRARWAKSEVARLETLVKAGAASDRSLSAARLALAEARAARRAAHKQLERGEAVQRAQGAAEEAIMIRSPHRGRVRSVQARPGAYVTQGQGLFELVDPMQRVVELDVPEVEAARLQRVEGAQIAVRGHDGFIALTAEDRIDIPLAVDDVRHTIPLWWRLDERAADMPPGLAVHAKLWVGAPTVRVAIPRAALVWDAGNAVVYVLEDGENFSRRLVRPGATDGGHVAILDGLAAGEAVVVEGAYLVKLSSLQDSAPDHGHAH